jgi:HAD superfamily hydrolase (TIGR01509 family)
MAQGVIFDIDGTLIDSVDFHAKSWQEILARYGYPVSFEEVRKQIGKGGDQLMPVFVPEDELKRIGEMMEKERLELFQREYLPRVRPFPKVRELFDRLLADGKRIALASSAKKEEPEKYKEIAGIADLIHAETSSDDAKRSKPHPDIFEAAMRRLEGLAPAEVVAVGDTPYDAQAAGKIDLRTVGVLCGGFPEAELREAGCIAIYRDPADLLAHDDTSPLAGDGRKG